MNISEISLHSVSLWAIIMIWPELEHVPSKACTIQYCYIIKIGC